MKSLVICMMLWILFSLSVSAQSISGKVTDAATVQPLDMATVVWERKGTPLNYVLTDEQGNYHLSHSDLRKGDVLSVNYLGYKKQSRLLDGRTVINFSLEPQSFTLKEVEIKGGRVYGRQDTTRYDVSRFISDRDNTLKDALKKLPGIDIAKNGTVSYNGKAISRFTIEGMDLAGGRYNLVNENLKAKDVDKAEIIDHFQPIRSLAQKVHSDDVALNIKLKPEAKGQWLYTLKASSGTSAQKNPILWNGNINALQIGKKKQNIYSLQGDNSGKDLETSSSSLINSNENNLLLNKTDLGTWLVQPSLDCPLDEERLRFNRTYSGDAHQILAPREDKLIRFTANYLHNELEQQTSNNSIYHLDNHETAETNEKSRFHKTQDKIQTGFLLEKNQENFYLKEQMTVNGRKETSHAFFQTENSEIAQTMQTPELNWKNELRTIKTKGSNTWSFLSSTQMNYSPSELHLKDEYDKFFLSRGYSDNVLNWMLKKGFLTQQYSAGICMEDMYLDKHHWAYSLYGRPQWELKKGSFYVQANTLLEWKRFCRENESFFLVSPQIHSTLKTGFHQEWSAFAYYKQDATGWNDFIPRQFRLNYRTWYKNSGIIPRTDLFSANLGYEYKHAIHELFWNLHAGYSNLKNNLITDVCLKNGLYTLIQKEKENNTVYWNINGSASKGFFDIHLKTACTADYSHSTGHCMTNGLYMDYTSDALSLEPKIVFSPSWGEFEYTAKFRYNNIRQNDYEKDTGLWNWVQNLAFTKNIGKIDIKMNLSHYRNDLYLGGTSFLTLADASVVWRMKKIRISTCINNFLNKKKYSYSFTQGNLTSTHFYELRPREWTVSIQLNL